MIKIAHVTASPFFGGPERQMLELAKTFRSQKRDADFLFVSFFENGGAKPFLDEAAKFGFQTKMLQCDMPHLWAASRELADFLNEQIVDVALLHGHKARALGYLATRKIGIPCIGVSRGWTTENWKVAVYTALDKWMHKRMTHVVCVSEGQAKKVRRCGVPADRISVIRNSIRTERFDGIPDQTPDQNYRKQLESLFAQPPTFLLGAAGRLSPEKGFDVLIEAISILRRQNASLGLCLFGDGFLLEALQKQARWLKIDDAIAFAGFTNELDKFMPHFDVFVQSSHTEGLPNVLLEAMAARVPVVATDVGGTSEAALNGETGFVVPANSAEMLAEHIQRLINDEKLRLSMGESGRKRVQEHFTFESQANAYWGLFQNMFCVL